jgi:prevent-host-death family protein
MLTSEATHSRLTSHMPKTYSTYEAKARLSELIDRVRKGDIVTITHRGEPVAEVSPITQSNTSIEMRLDELRRQGIVSISAGEAKGELKPLARKPGALRRFIDSRE